MPQQYDFDASKAIIRRFDTPAEGETPAKQRMVFSFVDDLGNKVTVRIPLETAMKELQRYVDEGTSQRLQALVDPAGDMIKAIRAAADEAISTITGQKATFATLSDQFESTLDKAAEEFSTAQKSSRQKINDALTSFASTVKASIGKASTTSSPAVSSTTSATPSTETTVSASA